MKIENHIAMNGKAKEAVEMYCNIFGTKPAMLMTYESLPQKPYPNMPDNWKEWIMIAKLNIGGIDVMMSDCTGLTDEFKAGNNVALSIEVKTEAEAKTLYEKLSAGGKIAMPLGKTFFNPCYALFTDKFGILWHIGVEVAY
jgi:PhnB protein